MNDIELRWVKVYSADEEFKHCKITMDGDSFYLELQYRVKTGGHWGNWKTVEIS